MLIGNDGCFPTLVKVYTNVGVYFEIFGKKSGNVCRLGRAVKLEPFSALSA